MPKWKSKAQQKYAWGVLVPKGKVSKKSAKSRSVKGKSYKRLPKKKK